MTAFKFHLNSFISPDRILLESEPCEKIHIRYYERTMLSANAGETANIEKKYNDLQVV